MNISKSEATGCHTCVFIKQLGKMTSKRAVYVNQHFPQLFCCFITHYIHYSATTTNTTQPWVSGLPVYSWIIDIELFCLFLPALSLSTENKVFKNYLTISLILNR